MFLLVQDLTMGWTSRSRLALVGLVSSREGRVYVCLRSLSSSPSYVAYLWIGPQDLALKSNMSMGNIIPFPFRLCATPSIRSNPFGLWDWLEEWLQGTWFGWLTTLPLYGQLSNLTLLCSFFAFLSSHLLPHYDNCLTSILFQTCRTQSFITCFWECHYLSLFIKYLF